MKNTNKTNTMIILLRKLTLKSKIGFGIFKECTVEEIMKSGRHKELINIYFRLANVTFTDDILDILHITDRLNKPGKKVELAPIYCAKFASLVKEKPLNIEHVRSVDDALAVYHQKQSMYNSSHNYSAHSLAWQNQGHKHKFI